MKIKGKEDYKAKMQKISLENKAVLEKRANKKRAQRVKQIEDRKKIHAEIDAAKAEGRKIGFQPSPVVKLNHKTKNMKEPLTGFNPFSKAAQLGKKK